MIIKTTSRSKCYIEFHSYCLEGEVALGDRGCTVGVSQPQLELSPFFFPHQKPNGVRKTPLRAATSLASSSWAGPQSICLW